MKNYIKSIFLILLCCIISSCTTETKKSTIKNRNNINDIFKYNKMPDYKYSDTFFNDNFVKDTNGDIYFAAAGKVYNFTSSKTLEIVYIQKDDNRSLVLSKLYGQYIYLITSDNNFHYRLERITKDGQEREILFDFPINAIFIGCYVEDNTFYFHLANNNDTVTYYWESYTLNEASNTLIKNDSAVDPFRERTELVEKLHPELLNTIIFGEHLPDISHFNKGTFYVGRRDRIAILNSQSGEPQFLELPEEIIKEDSHLFFIDLIDDNWYFYTTNGVFKTNINLETVETIVPKEEIRPYFEISDN